MQDAVHLATWAQCTTIQAYPLLDFRRQYMLSKYMNFALHKYMFGI